MAHTKGEWRVSSDLTQVTTSKKGILEGSKKICHMATFCKNDDEVLSNAKLISAAPDLLEAIQYYFDVLEEVRGKDFALKPDHVLSKMINAVKKATE